MKKIYYLGIAAALLALIIPTLVFAAEPDQNLMENVDILEEGIEEDLMESSDEADSFPSDGVHIIGKWGHGKDNVSDGFFAARIIRKDRVAAFKGVYNLTGDQQRTQIVGIMKKGYFNGKIIADEGEVKVTGLYRIDHENKLLKMQWMVPGSAGWAVARLKE